MLHLASLRGLILGLGVLVAAGSQFGCSMFREELSPHLTAEVNPTGVEDGKLAAPPANFMVEVQTAKGKSEAKEQPLAGHLTIQQALVETKANKRFDRFTLELVRPLPDGRRHRMTVDYDRTNKCVDPAFDYAILPGDRIIVVEDTTTMIDDMLDRAMKPFGGRQRLTGRSSTGARYRTEG
ncbi:MAG: hypothetical protein MUF06_12685 [Pirellulaceae bacterium]|jgi:hypothetical protein|nr:hypothetical protein [Pirellulaceae bacterium]